MKNRSLLITLMLVVAVLITGCQQSADTTDGVTGTFEGVGEGYGGPITLEVELKDSQIEKVTVKEHSETENLGADALETLTARSAEDQVAKFEAIAGATVTTNGYNEALADALEKAGLKPSDFGVAKEETAGEAEDLETDVLVIGAGGAGYSAAITAKEAGAEVLLIEKLPMVGGNTLISGGEYAAPNNWIQERDGIEDSVELFIEDVEEAGGDADLIKVMADNALAGAEWLRDDVGVEWNEELMHFGGHTAMRSVIPAGQSGVELINKFKQKAEDLGIETLVEHDAKELLTDDEGKVIGAKVETPQGEIKVAAKSVIITTGGFGANEDMTHEYDNEIDEYVLSTNSPGAQGDGILMAEALGAQTVDMEYIQLYPVCDVETGNLLYTGDTRMATGALLVNKEGKRFVEELDTRRAISLAIKDQTDHVAYQIWDEKSAVESGVMEDHAQEAKSLMDRGLMVKADTLEEAAEFFDIDAVELQKTLDNFNENSLKGEDPEFNLRKLGFTVDEGPFYIIKAAPAVHHTMGGLKIDTDTHVLGEGDTPIANLYAAGEVTGGIHGDNRLGSVAITDIVVFGRIAGENAAKAALNN